MYLHATPSPRSSNRCQSHHGIRLSRGFFTGVLVGGLGLCGLGEAGAAGPAEFDRLATDALRATETFRPAGDAALESAAANLRAALLPRR